jgi:ATP-binding cassette, subfamily B, bacterial
MASTQPDLRLIARARGTLRIARALRLVWDSSRALTLANLGIMVFQAAVPIAALYILKLIIDAVTRGATGAGLAVLDQVLWLIAAAAGIAALDAALRTVGALLNEAQGMYVTDYVTGQLHAKTAELDLEHYEDPEYQDLLLRTRAEAPTRPTMVLRALLTIGRSIGILVGVTALLVTAHWGLVAVLAGVALPGLLVRLKFARQIHHWMRERAPVERLSSYLNLMLASPTVAKDVRMSDLGPYFGARFRELRRRLREEGLRISRRRSMADVLTQFIAVAAVFAGIAVIAYQTLLGALTIGSLVMYLQAVQKAQAVFAELSAGIGGLYEHNLYLSHLDEFLALKPRITAPANPAHLETLTTGIEVRSVSFRYPRASRLSVKDVSLEARPGEMIAIVGANGSGKTTLMKLLCRLYDPTEGAVLLNGIDLRAYDPVELRRHISILFQDYMVFEFTASENIWFGDVSAPPDDRRITEAAELSGIHRVVQRFPKGLETPIGRLFHGAQDLSGGERQKLALARALYGSAGILILDEPSSALDPDAEVQLFQHLRERTQQRIVMVISHRFSTVRMADRIYVMDEGRITEGGTHGELMELGGTYARLFELQAAAYRGTPPSAMADLSVFIEE